MPWRRASCLWPPVTTWWLCSRRSAPTSITWAAAGIWAQSTTCPRTRRTTVTPPSRPSRCKWWPGLSRESLIFPCFKFALSHFKMHLTLTWDPVRLLFLSLRLILSILGQLYSESISRMSWRWWRVLFVLTAGWECNLNVKNLNSVSLPWLPGWRHFNVKLF